jgi:hypothetical protein
VGHLPWRVTPIESNPVIMGLEEAQALLGPYLQTPETYDPTDEWSDYSIPLIGAPINDTFKTSLAKRLESAWEDLAKRLQGAFLPLIQNLGLDEKAIWDLQDYITAVSQCAAFLKECHIDHDGFEEENTKLIKEHISSSTFDPYASSFIIQQDKMAQAVLTMWGQLVQSIGHEFTEQATRSNLNDGTFLSFQILASFVNDYLNHLAAMNQARALYSLTYKTVFAGAVEDSPLVDPETVVQTTPNINENVDIIGNLITNPYLEIPHNGQQIPLSPVAQNSLTSFLSCAKVSDPPLRQLY